MLFDRVGGKSLYADAEVVPGKEHSSVWSDIVHYHPPYTSCNQALFALMGNGQYDNGTGSPYSAEPNFFPVRRPSQCHGTVEARRDYFSCSVQVTHDQRSSIRAARRMV